ncbi:MAG: nucleoside monophosphate kinase [Nanoarchaeota archaeon]
MRIVLLGVPGAGKGLQAKIMVEYLKVPSISTGEMMREMVDAGNPLGIKLRDEYFARGLLAPDDITIELLRQRLEKTDCKTGFVLDGFPRSEFQAESLEKIARLNHVLYFEVPDSEVINRLSHRENCNSCKITYGRDLKPKQPHVCDKCNNQLTKRDDDNPESIKTRLEVYKAKTAPLVLFYEAKGLLRKIDGSQPYPIVADDVRIVLGHFV